MKFENTKLETKEEAHEIDMKESANVKLTQAEGVLLLQLGTEEELAMARLAEVSLAQVTAAMDAKTARDRRDEFCVSLESKYNLKGKRWTFNKKENRLDVK